MASNSTSSILPLLTLPDDVTHTAWNSSSSRLALASHSGTLHVWAYPPSVHSPATSWQAHDAPILKVVWAPPEFGHLLATCATDGSVSLWEEISSKDAGIEWRLVCQFPENQTPVLDFVFGSCLSGLKIVTAGGDGHIKIYETASTLELRKWQLQAEFPNVANLKEGIARITCTSASISWRPPVDSVQRPVFALGYCTSSQQFSTAKIWEFAEAYQRWQMIAELRESHEKPEPVHHMSWAPNVGRPFELIAVASGKSVSIWRLEFPLDSQGRLVVTRAARLIDHNGEVSHLDWDMTGMTLATSGSDGTVRLWQSNFSGQWQQQGIVKSVKDSYKR
ncbi:protein SEH1 [Physcomitrium patens]|uniref:Uncharacterized protein n=2 Tax=Physcomitrium patens TaxID=3218 RepID=A0A2K1KLF1_PHYPA|nr:protein SEH1-like [Physcomitrium patens]PNR54608.1 hypothetical protein PHYPA_008285 [Physcomitrium patens]|eukprot:XP_024375130.1 protein SEH1-like [Physcomitrella patens]